MMTKKQFLDEIRDLAEEASMDLGECARKYRAEGADLGESVKNSRLEPVNPVLVEELKGLLNLINATDGE